VKSLILGGARSGKSRLAERLAARSSRPVVYVATAEAGDGEMVARIAEHQARRPPQWRLVEQPLALAAALQAQAAADRCLLVDCLTLWLGNLLCRSDPALLARERAALLEVLPALPGELILVSNEVGLGVVPANELGRRFVDEAGRLHQAIAGLCDRVVFMAAGLPLVMKGNPHDA
jgi:adenosylcobinamide kinase/adenosylcobinamide-phosphate guanylyltransferase